MERVFWWQMCGYFIHRKLNCRKWWRNFSITFTKSLSKICHNLDYWTNLVIFICATWNIPCLHIQNGRYLSQEEPVNFERADDYGRSVVMGQHYLVGNFLEKTKSAKKGLFLKLSTKTAFFFKESIVYPFV